MRVTLLAGLLLGIWIFLPPQWSFGPDGAGSGGGAGNRFRGTQVMFVGTGTLNVRAEPSVDSRIVGLLHRNEKVRVDRKKKGWARVISPEQGYVALRHLRDAPQR